MFLLEWHNVQAGRGGHPTANAGCGIRQVEGAHAHRFRHTLATEILARGGSEQDAADILGISAAVVRKHYAKWSQARQQRITRIFEAVYAGTYLVHEEKGPLIN
ncbi:MAG: hypothetical protein ABSH56_35630 [Bryobacteraceae bacterium]|jgi:integrase